MEVALLLLLLGACAWIIRLHGRQAAALRALEARLGAAADGPGPASAEVVAELQAIREQLLRADLAGLRRGLEHEGGSRESLEGAIKRQEVRLAAIQDVVERGFAATGAGAGRIDSVRRSVLENLRDRGYRDIRLLAAPEELLADPCDLRVEAVREGVRVLGRVRIEGGVPVAVDLDPNYAMFP
ncbi:MAG TPA: hypothetical protein VGC54_08510 [Planctomycetota bacterium]